MPRMPSNLAAMKVTPGCLMASPKSCFSTAMSPIYKRKIHKHPQVTVTLLKHKQFILMQTCEMILLCMCPDWGSPTDCRIHTGLQRRCRSSRMCWTWQNYICGEALTKEQKGRQDVIFKVGVEMVFYSLCDNYSQTYSRRCLRGSSERRAPTGWRSLYQTPQWRAEEESPGRSHRNTAPGRQKTGT